MSIFAFHIILTFLFVQCEALSSLPTMSMISQHVLYDTPVSNNGARCRIIIYKKGLDESEVRVAPPTELGGLKSPDFLALNPQGKIPTMYSPTLGFSLPESDTICRYLLTKYSEKGPSFLPDDYKSNLLARFHDFYLTTIQGCMYKDRPPFGIYGSRKDALTEFQRQLQLLDDMLSSDGKPYLCGSEVSLADATIFPTMVFAKYMLPKFGISSALPPKLDAWFEWVKENDATFRRVFDEVLGGLLAWDERKRWDSIWMAGVRDDAPATLFDKIITGEIPATIVKEDDKILAFKDINPIAPAHVLVIPKDRACLTSIRKASPEHIDVLGRLMVAAGEIANDVELGFGDGARIVINDGPDGGQEVMHLHIHVLGGRKMTWPPG